MLNFTRSKHFSFNKNLRDYFTNITNESIRKITENHNLEEKKLKFKILIDNDNDDPKIPEFNFYSLLIFLSISSISFYLYKRLK